jgi:P pilus assembly chaperone PapD
MAFVFSTGNAFASDFLLHNETGHAITSFTTKEKSGPWSANWLKGKKIKPGDTWHMDFGNSGEACNVQLKVVSDDGYQHDYVVNFCKASEIFITVDSIEYH